MLEAHYAGTVMLALEIYVRLGKKACEIIPLKFVHFKHIGKLEKKKTQHKF